MNMTDNVLNSLIWFMCVTALVALCWLHSLYFVVFVNMVSSNGLCLSSICRDRSEVMGFNDMHVVTERDPCVAVFAAEVAVFFLRRCSNGTTLLSKSAIENILTSAGQVVRKAQSIGEVSASPFESVSAVLLRDEVVATIKECVFVLLGTFFF